MLCLCWQIWQISLDFPWAQAKEEGPECTISTIPFGLLFFWGVVIFSFAFFLPALHAPSSSTYHNSPGRLC